MNEALKKAVDSIDFDKYPGQDNYTGFDKITKKNITIIEGGGGRSTKRLLHFVAENGGKVIVIDLCTKPREKSYIDGKEVGEAGAGDYSPKKELYQRLLSNPDIKPYFEYYDMDIYEFFKNHYHEKIDFYFDDAVHFSDYLIPLFTMIMPRCNQGALLGTHDKGDTSMKEFCEFLKKHERVGDVYDEHAESLLVRLK